MLRVRSHVGQTAAEYMGLLLLVSAVLLAVFSADVPGKLSCATQGAVHRLTGNDAEICGGGTVARTAERDSDGDGVSDKDETRQGLNPLDSDSDGDGVSDGDETKRGSDPMNADTDGDGVSDADEYAAGSDPRAVDTDGDGVTDAEELDLGLNPAAADSDSDGLSDEQELERDTDPLAADSDGDGKLDGADKDPLAYNGNVGDALQGFGCNEWTFGPCPDADDPVRTSKEYMLGQLVVGFLSLNDARDLITAILNGKPAAAAMAAIGFVPVAGDALAMGHKVQKLIKRFPEHRGELIRLMQDLLPEQVEREALDLVTDGGYTAMLKSGVSHDTLDRLVARGTDVKRLSQQAHLTDDVLDAADNARLKARVKAGVWSRSKRKTQEAWGVESALMELEKTPGMKVLYDGRPKAGRPSNGPDIVAFNENTGRVVIVEAKGGTRSFGERTLRSKAAGNTVTQTEPDWLRQNANRYLVPLRNIRDDKTADALESIARGGAPYEVMIVNSRPVGKGGYGSGMDKAVANIKRTGQVADVKILDVQHDLR